MAQHAHQGQDLIVEVVAFPGFPESQPVIPLESRVDETPIPVFGDRTTWDLAALGISPSEKKNMGVFHFDDFPGDWNHLVRTFFMLLINPMDEKLLEAGLHRPERVPKLKTLKHYLYALRKIKEWAVTHDKPIDLKEWVPEDLTDYYDWVRKNYAEHLIYGSEQVFRLIDDLGPALPSYFLFEVPQGTARFPAGEIKTRPVDPDDFWALIHACWTYIDVFAPDIIQARKEVAEERERFNELPRIPDSAEVRRRLEEHFRRPDAFVPLHSSNRGPGTQGEVNLEGIGRIVDFRPASKTPLVGPGSAIRMRTIEDALKRGIPTRYGTVDHQPAQVTTLDGTTRPWCLGFDRTYVAFEVTKLRAACFIFISALSMMRLSEVCGLENGCLTTHYGAPALKSRVYKHQGATGKPGYWWVSDPVAKAVAVAEELTGGTGLLFQSPKYVDKTMDYSDEIHRFIGWVNEVGPGRGLRRISDPQISAHRLRRTMAIITATQPDGEIALGITLKHNATRGLANSVTSGYAAAPPVWERELGLERGRATAAELISDWSKREHDDLDARGPGKHTYQALLDTVEEKIANKTSIGDPRMLRDLLRDEVSGITLGTLNHCLGDPAKAECLKGIDQEAKKAGPIMAACAPSRCRNSVITDGHLPIWLAEEAELEKLLKDRRMAPIHRDRLKLQLKDVQRVTKPGHDERE